MPSGETSAVPTFAAAAAGSGASSQKPDADPNRDAPAAKHDSDDDNLPQLSAHRGRRRS
jgi:hypothetical protein